MNRVWITGASSGIGESCAYAYAHDGACLILTSSNAERLTLVAKKCLDEGADAVHVLPFDFQYPDGIDKLTENAWSHFNGIDILICNAGISQRTTVEETSMSMIRKIMEINFFAPVAISKAILPLMIRNGGGHVAVTTSIAGYFGFPLRCAYSSSKHALYGFFETLQAENYDKGIRVTLICPGRVKTNISINSIGPNGEKYGKMDPGQDKGLSPTKAAQQIVHAIKHGRREVLIGKKELLTVFIKRFFPGLCAKLGRKINPV